MALKDTLKLKLPIYQRGNVEFDEFLDAVGELLDGFKSAINNIQTYSDFQLIDEGLIDALAKQFGVEFPRNMSEERRRSYLREIVTLYRSKGTTGSMKRIFRIIGWEVTIEEYYIIDPSWFASPSDTYTITNEHGGSFELGLYERLAEGQLTYKNSQVFVDLVDVVGNTYEKRQIYGQTYEVNEDITFMKVPYIKILVRSEDFDLFTSDYVKDGNLYGYESSEEFEILESIKDYFIERNRPASVAIIEVSTPFDITDTFTETVIELNGFGTLTQDITYTATGNYITITSGASTFADYGFTVGDVISISGSTLNDGDYKIRILDGQTAYLYLTTLVVDEVGTGDTIINGYYGAMTYGSAVSKYDGTTAYGATVDRYISGESFGGFTYGEIPFDYYGVGDVAPAEQWTVNYQASALGAQLPLLIRKNSKLTLTQSSTIILIYATKSSLIDVEAGTAVWELIATKVGSFTNDVTVLYGYRAVYINLATSSSATRDVTIDLLT